MTQKEIRDYAVSKYKEGDTIKLWICKPENERKQEETKVKIIKFYENHVLIETKGFKSSVSYLEILKLTKKQTDKNKPAVDVEKLIKRQQPLQRACKYS